MRGEKTLTFFAWLTRDASVVKCWILWAIMRNEMETQFNESIPIASLKYFNESA